MRARYPQAAEDAVQHLLWALHRAAPLITGGQAAAAGGQMRSDLARYPGSLEDFAPFDLPELFNALHAGRIAFADQLGRKHLLQPGGTW